MKTTLLSPKHADLLHVYPIPPTHHSLIQRPCIEPSPAQIAPAQRAPVQRNTTIELARLVAALGVIGAHLPNDEHGASRLIAVLSPLRVPFFYSISLVLFVANLPRTTPKRIASRTWHRTLVPYLSWTLLYEALIMAKAWLVHGHPELVWWRVLFYGESAVQLYFLPTLLMLQVMALGLYLLLVPGSKQGVTGGLLVAGGVVYYACGAYYHCLGIGNASSIISFVAYLLAAFCLAPVLSSQHRLAAHIVAGGCLVLLAVCCNGLGNQLIVLGCPLVKPLGGIGALLLTTGLPSYWRSGWLLTATSFSFGIYLSHPLLIELFEFGVQRVYPVTITYTFGIKALEMVAIFLASCTLVLLLRKGKLVRRLFLGEQ